MVDAHDGETYTSEGSRLIWIDCEMTGLDIFGGDELVEVSVVPTDFDLNVLDEGVDDAIKPSQKAVDHMNDFVRAMHTRSGLIGRMGTRSEPRRSASQGHRIRQEIHSGRRQAAARRQHHRLRQEVP